MGTRHLTRRLFLAASVLAAPIVRASADSCSDKPLRIRVRRNFQTFDPADAWGDDAVVARNILAPLVRYKRANANSDWEWQKHLVTSITEQDHRTIPFDLRSETWGGSDDITADDVAFSFERIAGLTKPQIPSANRIVWSKLDKVESRSSRSAIIRLKQDEPDFILNNLASVAGCVVNKKQVDAMSGGGFKLDPGRTSGRYRICSLSSNDRVLLGKEDNWKGDPVAISAALFIVIVDDDAAQAAWRAGEIDVYEASRDVLDRVPANLQRDRGRAYRASTSRVVYLGMTSNGALRNPALRRAVQIGVNPAEVGRIAYGSADTRLATGLVPQGWIGWSREPRYRYQPDEAQRLTGQAGAAVQLRMLFPPDPVLTRVAFAVQTALAQVGMRVDLVSMPNYVETLERLSVGAADLAVFMGPPPSLNPSSVFNRFGSKQGLAFYANADYDTLLSRSAAQNDRAEALQSLNNKLIDDGAVAPLVEDHSLWLVGSDFTPAFGPDGDVGDLGEWTTLG